jgi:hypothetical protein
MEGLGMAISKCIKCGASSFESVESSPRNSPYVVTFIQCSGCGGVVGVMDYLSVGAAVAKIAEKLGVELAC